MTLRVRRNAARVAGLALVAVSVALLSGIGPAGADGPAATLVQKGWWWRAQTGSLPVALPPPPNVASGQLSVQGNPTDPNGTAFSAVRFAIDGNQTVGALTMKVGANGDGGGANAVVLACRTGSAWTAAEAGSWSTAPIVDTKACVNGVRSADGMAWTFAVKPLQVNTVLDIAIVPGVDPNTKTTSTFSLVFDRPENTSLTTSEGAPPPVSVSPPPSANESPTPAPSGSGSSSGSTFHAPAVTPVATGLPADKIGDTATSASKQAASQPGLTAAIAAAAPPASVDKRAGYIVLVFAAAVGLYAWRQDNLIAANGGRLPGEAAEVAGLGRFARPREGQPPALT